jgi:magnesium-transporting ATPase (P-type)
LALDLGTDTFSAVALGAEPARPGMLAQPPVRGRLLNRLVSRRAFGVLGPTEALFEMTAFVAVLTAGGWALGEEPPTSLLVLASGAAFLTVILAQSANAFACRSAREPVTWTTFTGNRFLVLAVALELAIGAACLLVPPLADALDHAFPTALGVAIAVASMPAVLAVDRLDKRLRRRRLSGSAAASAAG